MDGSGSLGLEGWRVLDAYLGAEGTVGAHPHLEEGLNHSLAQGHGMGMGRVALHWKEEGDPLSPVADPDHLHFEEGLDHSVVQE